MTDITERSWRVRFKPFEYLGSLSLTHARICATEYWPRLRPISFIIYRKIFIEYNGTRVQDTMNECYDLSLNYFLTRDRYLIHLKSHYTVKVFRCPVSSMVEDTMQWSMMVRVQCQWYTTRAWLVVAVRNTQ